MQNKVLMILCDGLRPDAVTECKHPFAEKLMSTVRYNPHAQTVFPSWTLPCHFSLFTSRTPDEHGVFGNTYVPGERKAQNQMLIFHAFSFTLCIAVFLIPSPNAPEEQHRQTNARIAARPFAGHG